jgi:hypothetical protein
MSGVKLEEEADHGHIPFDIFLSVSFSNLPFSSVLTLARRTGGITMPPHPGQSGTVGATRLGLGESDANGTLCAFFLVPSGR